MTTNTKTGRAYLMERRTITSPAALQRRISLILAACGGDPGRAALATPSPVVRVARDAYRARNQLFHARETLGFLHLARHKGVASLAWHYRAYAAKRRLARSLIHNAGKYLADAERGYAALAGERRAA